MHTTGDVAANLVLGLLGQKNIEEYFLHFSFVCTELQFGMPFRNQGVLFYIIYLYQTFHQCNF